PTNGRTACVGQLSTRVAVHGGRYMTWTRKARMDATGLPRGGSRSPLQTGQTHHSWPSVAWNVTDHGTSPWHLHLEKPFLNMCNGRANVHGHQSLARERLLE
ncbi:MAG: hypothetical protein R6U98_07870, partial [Pirellulaceae bacterium]